MTATAEFVVPKSIPMTEPLTFSWPPSAYPRANMAGALNAGVHRAAEAARGKNFDEVRHLCLLKHDAMPLTVRDNLEDNIVMCERDAARGDAGDRGMDVEMMGGRVGGIYDVVIEAWTI